MSRRLRFLARVPAAALATLLVPSTPASAESQVRVADESGTARIDPTYATTLRLSGTGFQSIRNGHGGIYVFFGAVHPGWRPSQGGVTGRDYFYVPDSESRDNQGFQKYVAFPGSDTATSANGGSMTAAGTWSTTLLVPGATFRAYDRHNNVRTIDCRTTTCGIITVGAHGVSNARNETFTPITIGSATSEPTTEPSSTVEDPTEPSAAPPVPDGGPASPPAGRPVLEVDRASASAGRVLAFAASGLPAGRQVSVVFDDGAAGAGPFVVGTDGALAGVVTIPATTPAGTHELRIFGVAHAPSVRFAVTFETAVAADSTTLAPTTGTPDASTDPAPMLFVAGAGLVLVLSLIRLGIRTRRARHET